MGEPEEYCDERYQECTGEEALPVDDCETPFAECLASGELEAYCEERYLECLGETEPLR